MLIAGLDFGYVNDPSCLLWGNVDEAAKEIWLYGEEHMQGYLNDAIAKVIIKNGLSKEIIIADSAEQKSIEEIKRLGVARIKPATKGQGSILQGIQLVSQYKIYVHPALLHTIEELQNYSWKRDRNTGEYLNEAEDSNNHMMDSLRYGMQILDNNQRLQSIPKKLLGL